MSNLGSKRPSPVAPIARVPLHEEVTARLRDMIVESQIKAGERIAELEVGALLGVSRTPIREALKVLAAEGLVEMQPLKGAVVRVFTAKDAQDMLQVIAMHEEFAAREACRASDAEIRQALALHERMRMCHQRRERHRYFLLNQQIHDAIVALAHNEALSMVHGVLSKRMRRLRYRGNQSQGNWDAAMLEHEEIAAALEARDGDRMARAIRGHLLNTWPRVVAEAQQGEGV